MGRGANDLSLAVLLQVDDSQASKIKGFGSVIGGLGGPLGLATAGLAAFGAISIGVIAQSVKVAAQYQQSMNMVQALTGASQAQMAQYDVGLKALAIDAGVAPTALSKGLYQVISAGYSGGAAMNVLTLATRDSKIGMTDAATTSEALTNVLANFTWQTRDANQVNGIMLETVTLGKSTFQQYASTISKASATSAQFHISLQTMSAAWATMTANGISAGKASTDYVQLVQAMDGKISTVTKSLHKNGIAFNETAFNAADFGTKVQMLNTAMQEAAQKHVTVTGVTLQAAQALTVISGHMRVYNSNLATLSNHQAMAAKTQQAWTITQGGFNQTMDRLSAAVQVLEINIGTLFLPILTRLVQAIIPVIVIAANWILQLSSLYSMFSEKLTPAIKIFSDAIYYVGYYIDRQLRPAVKLLTDEFNVLWGQLANPGQLNDTFKQTTDWMINIGTPAYISFATVVGDVLGGSYQKLGNDARNALGATAQVGKTIGKQIAESITSTISSNLKGFNIGSANGGILQQIFGPINQLNSTLSGISQFFKGVQNFFTNTFKPLTDEWNQMMKDLKPDFEQYAIWWKTVMQPLLNQLTGASVHPAHSAAQIGSPVKGALDVIRTMVEGVIRLGLNLQEVILPTIVKFLIWIKQTGMGVSNWIQTNGPNVLSFFQGLADATQQINQNIAGLGNIGNIFSWIGQHNPFGGPQNQGTGNGVPPLLTVLGGVGAKLPSFASGVTDFSGGLAYVHKDELLVNMSRGSNVFTASQSRSMLGGGNRGGGMHITHNYSPTINIAVTGRSNDEARKLAQQVNKELARMWRGNANIQIATSGSVRL